MRLEATGKNVELAIQNGLLECGLTREEVQVKVLEEGGLFKKAKVLLLSGEDVEGETKSEPAEQEENLSAATEVTESEQEIAAEPVEESATPAEPARPKRVVDTARLEKRGVEFLLGLVQKVDPAATVECTAGENEVSYSVKGENLGKLIGFHGENIQAIQLLLSGIKLRSEGPVRLYLDIDGYKANRNQALVDLANKTAEQAIKIERNIHLDPMNAYERRIIHTTIQGRTDVTTESTGEGEKRHVVIKPIFKK